MAIPNFIHSCPFCWHKEQCVRRKKCARGRGANFRHHVLLTKQVLLESAPSHNEQRERSFSLLAFLLIRLVHHLRAGTKVEKRQKSRSWAKKSWCGNSFPNGLLRTFVILLSAAAAAATAQLRIISTLCLSTKRCLRFQFACANTPPPCINSPVCNNLSFHRVWGEHFFDVLMDDMFKMEFLKYAILNWFKVLKYVKGIRRSFHWTVKTDVWIFKNQMNVDFFVNYYDTNFSSQFILIQYAYVSFQQSENPVLGRFAFKVEKFSWF